MEWLFSWEASSVFAPLLVAIAIGVLTLNDFKLAKGFFCAAAADCMAGIWMWRAHTTWTVSDRNSVSIAALLIVLLCLILVFRYTDKKEIAKKPETSFSPEAFAAKIIEQLKKSQEFSLAIKTEELQSIQPYDGFVQFESRSIAIETEADVDRVFKGNLRVGEVIRVKFSFANQGVVPVFDNQSWGVIALVDPAKNTGSQLRSIMLQGIRDGYEKFKNSGTDLGAGKEGFNFAVSTPLTKGEIESLNSGSLRVHIMLGGAYSNSTGHRFYWARAEWTNWPQVSIKDSFWQDS